MKAVVLTVSMLAIAGTARAQQPAIDHAHVHDAPAVAQTPAAPPTPAAPQSPAPGQPPAGPGGGGRGGPQVEVPWNDAVPPGTADHAARALKESSRHGEWADIKMADGGVLKSWVVYPERAQKAGVVLVIHDIRGLSDMARASAISWRRTASSPSFPTSCRGRARTAAAPSRSAATWARPSR